MYHYEYVDPNETEAVRKRFEQILSKVQDYLAGEIDFDYYLVGSGKRGLITRDPRTNKGFDLDYNIELGPNFRVYDPMDTKLEIINAINRFVPGYGYRHCEDSTSVITFKLIDSMWSVIEHSCDIAIVSTQGKGKDKRQMYIRHNKINGDYTWQQRGRGYNIDPKVNWIRQKGLWEDLKTLYLDKKNFNDNPDKRSRALFAEAVHEICQQNDYRG